MDTTKPLEQMDPAELEAFIQEGSREVDEIRSRQRRAHFVLEGKNAEAFKTHRENLPADYPPDQGVKGS